MMMYLEGEEISLEQLHDPFERALRRGHLIPVCFVSAQTGAGLNQLLRVFSQLMPSPLEGNLPGIPRRRRGVGGTAQDRSGERQRQLPRTRLQDQRGPLRGPAGHVPRAPGPGQDRRTGVYRRPAQGREAGAHLPRPGQATGGSAGGRGGRHLRRSKIEDIGFDAILHSSHDDDEVRMRPVAIPAPMYGVALELTQRGQEKKLSDALHKMTAEDPSLKIEFNAQANETVLRGMGELHLRIVMQRMKDEFGIDISTRPPKIAYRETVLRRAEGHHRHKKQTGGAGQFGEVFLKIEPLPRGGGYEFDNKVVGRLDTRPVHSGGGERRQAGARGRRHRRLSAAGRKGDRLRRQAPPGGFQGGGLRGRRQNAPSSTPSPRRVPSCWSPS